VFSSVNVASIAMLSFTTITCDRVGGLIGGEIGFEGQNDGASERVGSVELDIGGVGITHEGV